MLRVVALAFDFDGTLVDISKPYAMAFKDTLRNFRLPVSNPLRFYREGAPDLRTQFLQALSKADVNEDLLQKCIQMHCEIYMQIHLRYLKGFGEALDTVRELHSRGFKLALIGGRPMFQVEPELEFLGIRDCFDPVLTSEVVRRPKPAPDMVLRAAEFWNVTPDQILVVGDNPDDIASAKSAGAHSAGVCCGYFPREAIVKAKPDFLLDAVSDVLGILAD